MVRRLYDADHWEFVEGWNSFVPPKTLGDDSYGLRWDMSIGFVAFDKFKALLQDENGNISGPRTVVAGFGAGFTESILAVTPFESIKTQL